MPANLEVCMVGDGEMASEHSKALLRTNARLEVVVGQIEAHTAAFASDHGYRRWTVNLEEGLGRKRM